MRRLGLSSSDGASRSSKAAAAETEEFAEGGSSIVASVYRPLPHPTPPLRPFPVRSVLPGARSTHDISSSATHQAERHTYSWRSGLKLPRSALGKPSPHVVHSLTFLGYSSNHALVRVRSSAMNHGVAMDRLPIQLLRSDALARSGVDPTVLARLARRHVLHRVSAGRYAEIRDWGGLSELERYRLCVMAVASTTASDPVFSHHAAAALWRIPLLGHWPSKVDVTVPSASRGRSTGQIRRHCRASFPPPVA